MDQKNNRFDYVKYDQKAESLQMAMKGHFMAIEASLNSLPKSREQSLVMTKLEEAYMWIGKAIRNDQIERNGGAELQEERNKG